MLTQPVRVCDRNMVGIVTMIHKSITRRSFLGIGLAAAASGIRFTRVSPPHTPIPSPQQLAWQNARMGMFIHFGINTFTGREWGEGTEDPAALNPAALDPRQWARTAKAAGFRYIILTAKHHDGFCLWPSKITAHSVKNSPWRGGNGDVVREFVNAAAQEGLGVGLYLSPWDRHERTYGDSPRYNDFYCDQLTELLSWYGPIMEVWFDGANGEGPNGKRQTYDWDRIHRTVRRLQPKALMFSDAGPDIRWVGNEEGTAGDPNWCTADPRRVPAPGNSTPEIIDALQHGDPPSGVTVWRPAEAPVSIRPGWFWHEAEDEKAKSGDQLFELYCRCVGRNANLLLNVPPGRDGLLQAGDVRRLEEFGRRLRDAFGHDLASNAHRRREAGRLELTLPAPAEFDTAVMREEIAEGQSIVRYDLEIWKAGAWQLLTRGTTIGREKMDRFPPVISEKLRLTVRESVNTPHIGTISLYRQAP